MDILLDIKVNDQIPLEASLCLLVVAIRAGTLSTAV
jgi:hypothetical protein